MLRTENSLLAKLSVREVEFDMITIFVSKEDRHSMCLGSFLLVEDTCIQGVFDKLECDLWLRRDMRIENMEPIAHFLQAVKPSLQETSRDRRQA
jgi:hypothetical protein